MTAIEDKAMLHSIPLVPTISIASSDQHIYSHIPHTLEGQAAPSGHDGVIR